jgi:ParB family chromosome partitioning protein
MKSLTNQKPQLGKGMAALLGNIANHENKSTENSGTAKEIDINLIEANKEQPRKIFRENELLELASSIKENGIIQPLIVTEAEGKFSLIAGERRLRAAKIAGLTHVPVVVKAVTKRENLIMAIVENVQREELNCIEEALAYFKLMSEFSLTQEEVAKKIGKDRSTIANFLRLLKLPKDVILLLQKNILTFGHGKILASLKDDETKIRIANKVATEGLSVRELEILVNSDSEKKETKKVENKFFDQRMDLAKQKLEKLTGFHFDVNSNKKGKGKFTIKFNNEAEFNDICNYFFGVKK